MKIIKKIGGSYRVVLPKDLIEFYCWDNKPVSVDINSERILITKFSDIKIGNFGIKKMKKLRVNK